MQEMGIGGYFEYSYIEKCYYLLFVLSEFDKG